MESLGPSTSRVAVSTCSFSCDEQDCRPRALACDRTAPAARHHCSLCLAIELAIELMCRSKDWIPDAIDRPLYNVRKGRHRGMTMMRLVINIYAKGISWAWQDRQEHPSAHWPRFHSRNVKCISEIDIPHSGVSQHCVMTTRREQRYS